MLLLLEGLQDPHQILLGEEFCQFSLLVKRSICLAIKDSTLEVIIYLIFNTSLRRGQDVDRNLTKQKELVY